MSLRRCVPLLVLIVVLVASPAARADQRIVAGAPNQYLNSNVTIAQGEALYFRNLDLQRHDVTAKDKAANGKPLFTTPLIGTGEEALVTGAQSLPTGNYAFFCTIHTFMTGTVMVSSSGSPQPGPGAGGSSDSSGHATDNSGNGSSKTTKRKLKN